MKKIYPLLMLLGAVYFSNAQPVIPNAGFEMWDSLPGSVPTPVGWVTNATLQLPALLQRDTDAHTGNFAARLGVGMLDTVSVGGTLGCTFGYGPTKPIVFYFWLRTHLKGDDMAYITVNTIYFDTKTGDAPGGTITEKVDSSFNRTAWTQLGFFFSFPDTNTNVSDSCIINFSFSTGKNIESYYSIDDLRLSDSVLLGVSDIRNNIASVEIYPNPADNMGNMVYTLAQGGQVTLNIYNLLGERTEMIFSERQEPGTYRADINTRNLANGVYIAELEGGGNVVRQKFIVQH